MSWPDALPLLRQMLRVREAVVSLLQLQDSGFQQLSLVVEKGFMQVNLHGMWLLDRKRSYLHGQQGLSPNSSHHVCAHDNRVMGTSSFLSFYQALEIKTSTGPEYLPALIQTSVIPLIYKITRREIVCHQH